VARVNWFQAFAEVGLLALGAAIALGGDAWLDSRRELEEQHAYLVSLREDFTTNRQLGLEYIDDNLSAQGLAVELMAALSGPPEAVPTDSLNALINGALWIFDMDPARGTYEDMVSSGGLQLVRNIELRLALAAVDNNFESMLRFSELQWQHWMDFELPFLRDHAELAAIYPDYTGAGGREGLDVPPLVFPDAAFDSDVGALRSREFINIIAARSIVYQDAIVAAKGAVRLIESILDLIDQELGQLES
jgi:hypothetical protein